MITFIENLQKFIAASPAGKVASTDALWNSQLPEKSDWLPGPSDVLYRCVLSALPGRYAGIVYEKLEMPEIYAQFLSEASDAPVLRVAAIVGTLARLAQDGQISDEIRGKIDREKTDTLFWQILGQEKSLDAKTTSGTSWTSNSFMSSLPAQMQRVLDDCHFFSILLQWTESWAFYADDLAKVERVLPELLNRVEDPFHVQTLLQKLASGTSPEEMQRTVYAIFIKLGLCERAIWQRKPVASTTQPSSNVDQDTQSADKWAIKTLADPIPRTRDCVKNLCEQLYVKSQGSLDDTTRAHIREIPRRLTSSTGGINIISGVDVGIVDYMLGRIVDIADRGMEGWLLPSEGPSMSAKESQQHKEEFVKEQGLIVQCLKT